MAESVAGFRFVGVGIDVYEHFVPLTAVDEVQQVGNLLHSKGFGVETKCNVSDSEAEVGLKELLPTSGFGGEVLVVLWAGHGERTATNELRLITTDVMAGEPATRTARQLIERALRTEASQVLVVVDTCFSGAAVSSGAEVIDGLREAFPDPTGWVGVLAAARSFEVARDDVFAAELKRVLTSGPRDASLRLRFNAFNAGVRGDDVIDVIKQEWPTDRQRPDDIQRGLPRVMFPNPRWDPNAPEEVVEHLLLAAHGRSPDEIGNFFTGRRGPLQLIVEWLSGPSPGVLVVTGAAGAGKSAIVGRIVGLSNPVERAAIVACGEIGPDPGEGVIDAHVHARRLTVDGVAEAIDAQLRRSGVLPQAEPRNANALLGAIQTAVQTRGLVRPLNVVIDGVDEADTEAEAIADDLIARIARYARVLVASRHVQTAENLDLVDTMSTEPILNLDDPRWAGETAADLRAYVARRLQGMNDDGRMDPVAVGTQLLATAASGSEGVFLLARIVTSQLRETPVDTSVVGWEVALATSVEAAIDRDIDRVETDAPCGVDGSIAGRQLLTTLASGYGSGIPDDVWAVLATALGSDDVVYTRDDVYWLLGVAGRYVVAARGGDDAVYRLSHQRLAQHLRPPRPITLQLDRDAQALAVAAAVIDYYRSHLEAGLRPDGHRYLWNYARQHCVDAGTAGINLLRPLADVYRALVPDLAWALMALAARYSGVGRHADAITAENEAIGLYRPLAAANPAYTSDLAMAVLNRSLFLSELGRPEEALAAGDEAIGLYRPLAAANPAHTGNLAGAMLNRGRFLSELGRLEEGLAAGDEAIGLFRPLTAANPAYTGNLAMAMMNRGRFLSDLGRLEEGLAAGDEAIGLFRPLTAANPAYTGDLAGAVLNRSRFLSDLGRPEEALAAGDEAIGLYRPLAAANPAYTGNLAKAMMNLGRFLKEVGRLEEALAAGDEAIGLYRPLAAANPGHTGDLAMAVMNRGGFLSELGRPEEGLAAGDGAIGLYRPLAAANPAYTGNLAMAVLNRGRFLSELGRPEEALAACDEAIGLFRPLAAANPAYTGNLAMAVMNRSRFLSELGRPEEALAADDEAIGLYRPLAAANPAHTGSLAAALTNRGGSLSELDRPEEALAACDEAIGLYRPLAAANTAYTADLAMAVMNRSRFLSELGRPEEALAADDEAIGLYRPLAAANPAHTGNLAAALTNRGGSLSELDRPEEALAACDEAIGLFRPLAAANTAYTGNLAMAVMNRSEFLSELDRPEEALAAADEATGLYRTLAAANPHFVDGLVAALDVFAARLVGVGRTGDEDSEWQTAYDTLDPTGRAILMGSRAAARASVADAVADLIAAESQGAADSVVFDFVHSTARDRRADDTEEFDNLWERAAGEVPQWLTLDPGHLAMVEDWIETASVTAEAEFAATHGAALLEESTELALREVALRFDDPTSVDGFLDVLNEARQVGFAQAYEPLIAADLINRYLTAEPHEQIRMLRHDRDQLLAAESIAVMDELTADDPDEGGVGAGLLRLAIVELDGRTVNALADAELLVELVDDLIRSGESTSLVALAQTVEHSANADEDRAFALAIRACGLALRADHTQAADTLRAARRLDDQRTQAFLPQLAGLILSQPALAALAPVFAEPLSGSEED